jgi:hypothetical protein
MWLQSKGQQIFGNQASKVSHILKLEPSNFYFATSANSIAPITPVSEFVVFTLPRFALYKPIF